MKDALPVVFQRRAAREVEAIAEWWRVHRTVASRAAKRRRSARFAGA